MISGEERAFDDFFQTYFPALFRFALARLGQDTTAAEEVVQRALCKSISKISTYRGEAALFTWLCTFCRHEICDYLKSQNRILSGVEYLQQNPEMMGALESLMITIEKNPEELLLSKETAHLVHSALDTLPARYADALEWKYIEDLPVKEIATRLNLGLKAAESLLTRARIAFRDAFLSLNSGLQFNSLVQQEGGEAS
jgi:RNA polymerase sigma-70 factor (ECF subfamily)